MKEYTLDCKEMSCPLPLLKTEKQMREMEVGDIIIVTVGTSCAVKTVPDWAREQGYNVEIDQLGDELWDVVIEKSK